MKRTISLRETSMKSQSYDCRLHTVLGLLLLASFTFNSTAVCQSQQPPNPRAVFSEFFDPLLGEWECKIREWRDPAQPPVWEDRQIRRFERILRGRFLQEWAYVSVQGNPNSVAAGMHLTSFDPKSGKVYQSGYWAQAAGRLFEFEGTFNRSGKRIEGMMTIRLDGGGVEKRRVEIEWEGQTRHIYRVFKRLPSGLEFLHEEFVYTRQHDQGTIGERVSKAVRLLQ
ncbi:MAG TPA: DUF1579 family protein [Pyrinomonadaceae bacterium]|nr:DUF1579 family protein [Pyrinomonadaceae bacterium]